MGTDAGPEEAREGVRLVDIGGRAEPYASAGAVCRRVGSHADRPLCLLLLCSW